MAKRGPKTEAGKAMVRTNAARHGILSTTPVIPGLEREEDWEAHRAGLLHSLAPEGDLESAIAERIILLLWRLQRVARYEREAIAISQELLEDDIADADQPAPELRSVDEAHQKRSRVDEQLRVLEEFTQLPSDASIDPVDAEEIIDAVGTAGGLDDLEDVPTPDFLDDWYPIDDVKWTAGLAREAFGVIASFVESEVDDLLEAARDNIEQRLEARKRDVRRAEAALDRARRERLLPDSRTLDKAARYEAHLNRQFYQALHELEALQARRQGEQAPLARVDVAGLPDGS